MQQKFNITGMTCSACSAHVEKSVAKLSGVSSVQVNLLGNSMTVVFQEDVVTTHEIIAAVSAAGYGASLPPSHTSSSPQQPEDSADTEAAEMKKRLYSSVFLLVVLMYVSMGHMVGLPLPSFLLGMENAVTFGMTQFLLTLPILYLNRSYFEKGFKALWHRSPTMDSLIAIGSTAAVVYSIYALLQIGVGLGTQNMNLVAQFHMDLYFESAGTILTLITVGKYLEARSKGKTSDAIRKLMNLAPKTAIVLRGGEEQEVPLEEVQVGETVIVRPGAAIPVDGVVLEGSGTVDESAITGESLPVDKKMGDPVTGATLNKAGWFQMEAKKVGEDTTLSQIVRLVEDANSTKAPIAKLADKVSGIFVPVVISLAVLAAVIWLLLGYSVSFALSIGIAILVISCPCALGLATPTAIMVGTGKGAEQGILFKTAQSLETAHTINTVVLDKTGTITQGTPSVTDIVPYNGTTPQKLLSFAASLEQYSEHPLARAIVTHGKENHLSLFSCTDFGAIPGEGILGTHQGKPLLAGNLRMMEHYSIPLGDAREAAQKCMAQGKTPLFFCEDGILLGMIALADVVKPTSREAVAQLRAMGIDVVMLTGDNPQTAQAIGVQTGIQKIIAQVLPADKEKEVAALQAQGKKVAMIGDGINDAPALARADVGIAIGAGTDIAMESADIVLMKSDLLDAATAIELSRAVLRNIKQNLFWAFFYNAVGIPLAGGVFFTLLGWKLNPMFAAAAMSLSSVCVVSNALRLRLFKPKMRGNVPLEDTNILKTQGGSPMEMILEVDGMSCGHCSARVEKALAAVPGVTTAVVDLEAKTATVTLGQQLSPHTLKKAVEDAGYTVTSIG